MKIYPRLQSLLVKNFFRFYKVNLKQECPFWPDDSRCAIRFCQVENCEEQSIPEGIKEKGEHRDKAASYKVRETERDSAAHPAIIYTTIFIIHNHLINAKCRYSAYSIKPWSTHAYIILVDSVSTSTLSSVYCVCSSKSLYFYYLAAQWELHAVNFGSLSKMLVNGQFLIFFLLRLFAMWQFLAPIFSKINGYTLH